MHIFSQEENLQKVKNTVILNLQVFMIISATIKNQKQKKHHRVPQNIALVLTDRTVLQTIWWDDSLLGM